MWVWSKTMIVHLTDNTKDMSVACNRGGWDRRTSIKSNITCKACKRTKAFTEETPILTSKQVRDSLGEMIEYGVCPKEDLQAILRYVKELERTIKATEVK